MATTTDVKVRCRTHRRRPVWQRLTAGGWAGAFTTKREAESAVVLSTGRILCPIREEAWPGHVYGDGSNRCADRDEAGGF